MNQDSKTDDAARLAVGEKNWALPPKAGDLVPASPSPGLPVPASPVKQTPSRRWWLRLALALVVMTGGAGASYYWWHRLHPQLPSGIALGNGRLEADEIDIDTKYAGRIAEMMADEGDMVKAGQVVARMDTRDLEASLKKSQAQVRQAQQAVEEANANVAQQESQVLLAEQQHDRAAYLAEKGFQTKEVMDQRQQQLDGAKAALSAAKLRVIAFQHALDAATHDVELYSVQIADNTLVAPREGRIQYRVANIGEVLPAGGKVFVMLDTSYVYMDIYLPTEDAGKVRFGADARIVLDAYPNVAIPAKVSFISPQAQFTPKIVETQSERDKLMFRIRVRVDPERLRGHAEVVRSGLPGVAYVLTDPAATWPAALQRTAAR
jgi:HlyD family secretion protein